MVKRGGAGEQLRSPAVRHGTCPGPAIEALFREPKIGKFQMPFGVDQDIVRFEIAVD
jgi:hypothetical protein